MHAYSLLYRRCAAEPNLTWHVGARTTAVAPGRVTAERADGTLELACDDIVVCGGVAARTDEALAFAACTPRFFLIGDAHEPKNIRACARTALAAASKL